MSKKAVAAIAIDFSQFIGEADDAFEPVSCADAGALVHLIEAAPIVEAKASRPVTLRASSQDRPCKRVWDIADAMKGQRRCDIIRACEAAGIATNTARTQYQQWYALNKPA